MASTVVGGHPVAQDTFRGRLFRAWTLFQLRRGASATQTWLGEEVARVMNREEAFIPSTVSRWFGGQVPELETLVGLAKVLGCDPGWLTFGEESKAPPPEDPFRGMAPSEQPD